MKPVVEWDLNYIMQLPLGELDWVEFKGRKMLDFTAPGAEAGRITSELSRQLSAFANSGGGVLVYGIHNPTDNTLRKVDDGGVLFTSKKPNIREWLEDVIPNLVEFQLKKFNVYALTSKAGAPELADDRCIILVDIPDSSDVPHQAVDDKRYYARVGGRSKPVNHRFVMDMFHREQHAKFEVLMAFKSEIRTYVPMIPIGSQRKTKERHVSLFIGAENKGKRLAKYMRLTVYLPECVVPKDDQDKSSLLVVDGKRYYVREFDNTRRDILKTDPTFGVVTQCGTSWYEPILPSLGRHWEIECPVNLHASEMPKDQKIMWKLYCDNAPVVSGEKPLDAIPFAEE